VPAPFCLPHSKAMEKYTNEENRLLSVGLAMGVVRKATSTIITTFGPIRDVPFYKMHTEQIYR